MMSHLGGNMEFLREKIHFVELIVLKNLLSLKVWTTGVLIFNAFPTLAEGRENFCRKTCWTQNKNLPTSARFTAELQGYPKLWRRLLDAFCTIDVNKQASKSRNKREVRASLYLDGLTRCEVHKMTFGDFACRSQPACPAGVRLKLTWVILLCPFDVNPLGTLFTLHQLFAGFRFPKGFLFLWPVG